MSSLTIIPLKSEIEGEASLKVSFPKTCFVGQRISVLSPVEFYKKQLEDILSTEVGINDTKLYLLAFIKVYGLDYKQHVINSRICTSLDSINNYESVLRKSNLLVGYWPDAHINPEIKLNDNDSIIIVKISKDPTLTNVNHKNYQK